MVAGLIQLKCNALEDIDVTRALYRASGSTLKSPGYLAAYGIPAEEEEETDKEEGASSRLPPLAQGETLTLLSVTPEKKETQPPPRFNEASLVKTLDLKRPIYRATAAYGHFGRDDKDFTWEATDKAAKLASEAGLREPALQTAKR